MEVGELIKRYRQEAGLSQWDLSKKTGFSIKTISAWEYGARNPKVKNIKKIADALGVSAENFMQENHCYGKKATKGSWESFWEDDGR